MDKEQKKTLTAFSLAAFLNDVGANMIYAVWPLFVTSFLGVSLTAFGLLEGIGDSVTSLSQAFAGFLSDKLRKRKIFIWLGYFFGSIAKLGMAFSNSFAQLIPLRIIDRGGKVRDSPRDAMLADASTKNNRGSNFGILESSDKAGWVIGTLIAIFFFAALGYRNLFLLAAIPPLIGAVIVFIMVKEKKSAKKIGEKLSFRNITGNLKLYTILSAIGALGTFTYSFLLIYASKLGFQVTTIPVLFLVFTLTSTLFSAPFGKLADKIGRKAVIAFSYIFWIAMSAIFIYLHNVAAIVIAFVLYGLSSASFYPVNSAFVSEMAPKKYRASVLGGFNMIMGLVALPASFIAGLIWDKIDMFAPLYLSIILNVIPLIMLIFVKESKQTL